MLFIIVLYFFWVLICVLMFGNELKYGKYGGWNGKLENC